MRVPYRKPGKYAQSPSCFKITAGKYRQLQNELKKMTSARPRVIAEMQKHAADGDFSENAPYQIAKGQLRGLNRKIEETQNILKKAEIIMIDGSVMTVALGHFVTVKTGTTTKTYQILGSLETDPARGIISHDSPVGSALLGHASGETVKIKLGDRTIECQILAINNSLPNADI